jgi:farnesyl-diphosphate farnesyltransferase
MRNCATNSAFPRALDCGSIARGMPDSTLLTDLLPGVSRSFYLTLRVLPAGIRPQIGIAYLLARATDTIADTTLVPVERRLAALQTFQAQIRGATQQSLKLDEFLPADIAPPSGAATDRASIKTAQTAAAERRLLQRIDEAFQRLDSFSSDDQQRIRQVLAIITSGQELDLTRFAGCSSERIVALRTDADLDDYTYRVAGCVGEFWTRTCRAHLFPRADLNDEFLLSAGVRFGKGLQLVNVLRDLPADLRQGRCYLPAQTLQQADLDPATLLDPANQARLRPVLRQYRELAAAHLAAGWAYTRHLPWRYVRVRLACAWPLLIGIQTLAKLENASSPISPSPVKVTRRELQGILTRSLIFYPVPWAWDRLFPAAKPNQRKHFEPAGPSPGSSAGAMADPKMGRNEGKQSGKILL